MANIALSAVLGTVGGPATISRNIIENLSKIDKRNSYTLYTDSGMVPDVNTVTVKLPFKFYQPIWNHVTVPHKVKWNNFDLYHSTKYSVPIIKPCKTVVTIFDLAHLVYPESFHPLQRRYENFDIKHASKYSDKIITISHSTKNDLIKFLNTPEEKISVIYCGVSDVIRRINDQQLLLSIKNRYRLPDKYFLYVGTLQPRKNIQGLIKAYHLLKMRKVDLTHKLVLVGRKGWLYDEIFSEVKKLGIIDDVLFTGSISDYDEISSIYTLADAVVYPSFYEGFGLMPLEAMACHTPCIVSNNSSLPEVVGEAGLYVDPYRIEEITSAMEQIVVDSTLRNSLVDRGIKRLSRFSWAKAAEETLEVYERTLA